MVHIEHASIAGRTMVTSFRFENIAHEAVSTSFIFGITQMEAPKHWDLTRIGGHCLEEGPKKHDEEEMEESQHDHHRNVV